MNRREEEVYERVLGLVSTEAEDLVLDRVIWSVGDTVIDVVGSVGVYDTVSDNLFSWSPLGARLNDARWLVCEAVKEEVALEAN